jgi:hypothetical protein
MLGTKFRTGSRSPSLRSEHHNEREELGLSSEVEGTPAVSEETSIETRTQGRVGGLT